MLRNNTPYNCQCYQVFYKKVTNSDFPKSLDQLIAETEVEDAHKKQQD
ncbi:hypothetical protein QUB80_13610 [Chlorogloeopsis sp. ULAP01]|nr:hypothetical protein [Chlorogloeopsis sp. ULAP01]MDM9381739.1 hypothetical protein [Chlorogloeopsis sp. ULAP01]